MGLKGSIQTAVQSAFLSLDDIVESVTYRSKTSSTGDYYPAIGKVVPKYTDYASVEMAMVRYKQEEIDDKTILNTDMKAIVPSLDLTPTPKVADQIIRANTSTWEIIGIQQDPAEAVWIFQIRKA